MSFTLVFKPRAQAEVADTFFHRDPRSAPSS